MPMTETEIKCPDCGRFLTDVDGMLECQGDIVLGEDQVIRIVGGCGGSTGWTDEDWGVWYPGREQRPNPQNLDIEQRAEENKRLANEAK